jgi:2-oxoglutarate ferredoxin oxidoreductase subunit alpha
MMIDFNIMVGGEAGQGVQSVGAILAGAMARGGLDVFADQDYESRVRGGHNFFRIRVRDGSVFALSEKLDILVALNQESVELHENELKDDGVIIFDGDNTGVKAKNKRYFNVPLVKIAEDTVKNKLMTNTVAAGATIGIAGYDFELLTAILKKEFGRYGDKVINDNITAARAGYDYVGNSGGKKKVQKLSPVSTKQEKLLINGNEAIALGAMVAGCKFISGYPMTPASSILEYMADKGRQYGVVAMHVEDEIAAMNMAVGAGYTGVRAMIATSGGGFALMVEALALAGMTETPVVAVLGQRPGPATGLPTRTEQGELWFSLHAGHGEFPRAVLAPGTAEEAFYSMIKAFNLAERYQTPVIVLTDHHLASSYVTVDRFDLKNVVIDRGELLPADASGDLSDYKRHLDTESGISPRALPGLGRRLVITDSDEHDEAGHMIEDGATRNQQDLKRLRKRDSLAGDIDAPEINRVRGAEALLIGWGSTRGAIEEAAEIVKGSGNPVNTMYFNEIWPFPVEAVSAELKKSIKTVVIEGNATAQLAALIRRETGYKVDHTVLKFDGRPFSPEEIIRRLQKEVF